MNDNKVRQIIGAHIRRSRELKKMTQGELGEAVGVSFQQIQKYERGANAIAADVLFEIAKRLEKPVWVFFPDSPVADADLAVEATLASKPGVQTALALTRIQSEKLRATVPLIVEALVLAEQGASG